MVPRGQPWTSTTDEVCFAASASGAAVTVIACADDNVVRLTPAAKIVVTSAFIPFLLLFICTYFSFCAAVNRPGWRPPFGAQLVMLAPLARATITATSLAHKSSAAPSLPHRCRDHRCRLRRLALRAPTIALNHR